MSQDQRDQDLGAAIRTIAARMGHTEETFSYYERRFIGWANRDDIDYGAGPGRVHVWVERPGFDGLYEHLIEMISHSPAGSTDQDPEPLLSAALAEAQRLRELINTPHTDDFLEAVRIEAAHQRQKWKESDALKDEPDWFWTLGALAGKALKSWKADDREKMLHHVITSAALCLNWHRHLMGESDREDPS